MSILTKFYDYLGVSDNTINGEQLFSLICLLGKEQKNIDICKDPVTMCQHILEIYVDGMETGFKHITEDDIICALKCMN